MRRVMMFALALAVSVAANSARADGKYSTKDVMTKAHKSGLAKKVVKGTATADEKKLLVELYESMAANKPTKGDAENWKKLNDELVAAAKAVEQGTAGAGERLGKAMNCGACHSKHK